MTDAFSLAGRVAVVTGGTGAIGAAVAAGLAGAGAAVAVVARGTEGLERTVQELGGSASGHRADVLDEASLAAARDEILARHGAVHVLVNCAGGNVARATLPDDASPFDLPLDAYREVVELNLLGTISASRVLGGAMRSGDDGSVVNVSSVAAGRALTRVGGYAAAKAGVESYTRWLAVELGRRGTGIRVNAILPGFVLGEQNRALLLNDDGTPTDRGRAIVERTPLGRLGEPQDLGSTVVWLASPASRFVTGAVVPVDGGYSAFAGV